jgi:hypothetical protein
MTMISEGAGLGSREYWMQQFQAGTAFGCRALQHHLPPRTLHQLLEHLDTLHAPAAINFSLHLVQIDSCHSSEGGERQHVVVLDATNFSCYTLLCTSCGIPIRTAPRAD